MSLTHPTRRTPPGAAALALATLLAGALAACGDAPRATEPAFRRPAPTGTPAPSVAGAGLAGPAYTFTGAFGTAWNDPRNWSPAGVPTDGDTVIVARQPRGGVELVVPRPIALGGLLVGEGGRLRGDTVAVTGRMQWTGGEVYTPLRIASGARAELAGADHKYLYPPGLTNAGTVVVRGPGQLRLWYGPHVANDGTFELQGTTDAPAATVTASACCVNPSRFVNNGTLVASGVDTLNWVHLVNRGQVRVAAGSVLSLNVGPWEFGSGTRLAGGGRVKVTVGEDSLGLAQAVRLEDGTTLEFAKYSDLRGALSVSGAGAVEWTGGTIAGTLAVATGTRLRVRGPEARTLAGTIANAGSATWADTGLLSLSGPAVVRNTGTFDMQSTVRLRADCCTRPARFVNEGRLLKSGGTARSELANLFVDNAGTIELRRGTVDLRAGEYTQTAGFTYLYGGHLASAKPVRLTGGTLRGAGTITGSLENGGQLRPGSGPGALRITGDFTQTAAGTLYLEVAGRTAGSTYDQLRVGGTARLGGTAAVVWSGGFVPAPSDAFSLLTYAARAGGFAAVSGLAYSPELTFRLDLDPTAAVLRR